ncbi:hypothetical protein [Ancylobacter sp.]|uniref:hypothetical protein n=1 Tax=Ancylobacter sp. TaxID=1872567 RepID=UPI003C7ABB32
MTIPVPSAVAILREGYPNSAGTRTPTGTYNPRVDTTRRVKDLTNADMNKALKDIMAGTTRATLKTKSLRCKAIVRFDIRSSR